MAIKKSDLVKPPDLDKLAAEWEKMIDRLLKQGQRRFLWSVLPTLPSNLSTHETNQFRDRIFNLYQAAGWILNPIETDREDPQPTRWGHRDTYRIQVGWEFS